MDFFRESFRSIAPIYNINSSLRAKYTKRKYRSLAVQYDNMADVLHPVLLPRDFPAIPHILFLGTDEQQDRGGIIQALGKLGRLTLFTRSDGAYGQNDPDPMARPLNNSRRLEALFSQMASENDLPQLLIAQTWSDYIDPALLSALRDKYGVCIVNIGMDDRHRWDAVRSLIPHLDLALTAAPECIDWYHKEGCPALFFPEASDPDIFHPMPELPKIHDVCFVGAKYGLRDKIVRALQKAGIRVTAFGTGWEGDRLPVDEVPRLFAQSRIVLGVGTIGHCTDFFSLKMRDFDGPMSGSLYLTHDNPDLQQLFRVGKEIITYDSIDACVMKARYYLDHDDEREAIGLSGHQRALVEHSWQQRFSTLFQQLQEGSV